MRFLLGCMTAAATLRPRMVLAALFAVTVGLGAAASTNEFEVDLTQFGSEDSEAVQAMDRLREEFGDPGAAVQLIVDAGAGGNLLTAHGFRGMAAAEEVALGALGDAVRTGEDGRPQMLSLRSSVDAMLAQQGLDTAALGDEELGAAAARAVSVSPQVAGLVSDDVELADGSARGAMSLVLLDPTLAEAERTAAGERVEDAFETTTTDELGGIHVSVFSSGLFVSGLLDAIRAEVPLLFALALLVVLSILGLMYRSVFDVAVGFAGLLATVAWTFGLVALLGPNNLALAGPLSQLAVIVPVLLVGLGIDYSVHLTARYREQRAADQPPKVAANRALHTVGAALVLATAATAIGFGSIATAPLRMLADFGLFVAVGVVCAFVIMGLLVPAARVLRDRGGNLAAPAAVRELGLGRLMRWPSRTAVRRPWAGMAVATVLVALSLAAATGLQVEFDRDDFVPEGSDVEAVLAHQQALFGGGVTESTFVLVDGDLTDPGIANAVWDGQNAVADIEGVRTVGGSPQVVSALTLAANLLDPTTAVPPGIEQAPPGRPSDGDETSDAGMLQQLAAQEVWTGSGFAEDADLSALYQLLRDAVGDERIGQLLAPDAQTAVVQIRTTVGDAGAERMGQEIHSAFAPVTELGASVTVTSDPMIIAEMSDELATFQIRSIALTLGVVLILLTAYYALTRRRPLLGGIALLPAAISAALVLSTMWVLDISFNVLTATLTAIAVGIGVPYGVHVVNRFVEDLDHAPADDAIATTMRNAGGALTGSALTTLGAFVVLAFSGLPPIRSLGLLGGAAITFALLAAVLVQPGALTLWARRCERRSTTVREDAAMAETASD